LAPHGRDSLGQSSPILQLMYSNCWVCQCAKFLVVLTTLLPKFVDFDSTRRRNQRPIDSSRSRQQFVNIMFETTICSASATQPWNTGSIDERRLQINSAGQAVVLLACLVRLLLSSRTCTTQRFPAPVSATRVLQQRDASDYRTVR